MAVTADVMDLIRVLDEEGFGALASELLAEISVGRRSGREENSNLEEGEVVETGLPLSPEEQLNEAVRILRLRLVEPARHLAEAERIAAVLADRQQIAIRFVDEEGSEWKGPAPRDAPGEQGAADDLHDLLERIRKFHQQSD
jgi:hypothetical protein